MANDADRLSSPFDEMLANNREQFDALYGGEQGGLAGARRVQASTAERQTERAGPSGQQAPLTVPSSDFNARSTPSAGVLDEWFGDRWRFEITDQRRDRDEIVVVGRVIVADQGIEMTGIGRATVAGATPREVIEGTVAGIAFQAAPGGGSHNATAVDTEEAGFKRAAVAALAQCVQLP